MKWLNKERFLVPKKQQQNRVIISLDDKHYCALFVGDNTQDQVQVISQHCGVTSMAANDDLAFRQWVVRHKLENAATEIVLSPNLYRLLVLDKPKVSDHEIMAALPWLIHDLVDYPNDDLIIDYFPLPDDCLPAYANKIFVIAAQKSRVQLLIEPIVQAKLEIQLIDVKELALCQLISRLAPEQTASVYFEADIHGSFILYCQSGHVYFSRNSQWRAAHGVDDVINELHRAVNFYESQMKLPKANDLYWHSHLPNFSEEIDLFPQRYSLLSQLPSQGLADVAQDYQPLLITAIGRALTKPRGGNQ